MAFCNTLIDICQMETREWIKHMLFLYLRVPDNDSILLNTTEHGLQLNITTELQGQGRRTKKKNINPTNWREEEKEEQQCHQVDKTSIFADIFTVGYFFLMAKLTHSISPLESSSLEFFIFNNVFKSILY